MIRVNFNTPLLTRKGEPFTINGAAATIGDVCSEALDAMFDGDRNEKFSEKMKKWNLMELIRASMSAPSIATVSHEDAIFLQERVAQGAVSTTVVARVAEALDGHKDAETGPSEENEPIDDEHEGTY